MQYEIYAHIYALNEQQKLDYAAVILRGDALQFFDEHARGKFNPKADFKRALSERFNRSAVPDRVKSYLQRLRFDQFVTHGTGTNATLIKLVPVINKHYS